MALVHRDGVISKADEQKNGTTSAEADALLLFSLRAKTVRCYVVELAPYAPDYNWLR